MNYNNNYKNNNQDRDRRSKPQPVPPLPFTELTNDNYVSLAEKVIEKLNENKSILTTSQLRNILSLNSEIFNTVVIDTNSELSDSVCAKLQYLKVRMVYDSGRDNKNKVKDFIENSHLIEHIDKIGKSKEKYILFSRYMEALVAYRKFIGHDR